MKTNYLALALIAVLSTQNVCAQTHLAQFIDRVTDEVIMPRLEDSLTAARALSESSQLFCAEANASTLSVAKAKWTQAMQGWSRVRLFKFGPMIEKNIDLKIHYLPIRKNQILSLLKTNQTSAEQLPVSARGLASIEYLLFDREKSQSQIIKAFTSTPQRCQYLVLLSQQLVQDNHHILSDWSRFFAGQFKGENSKITQHEAAEQLFRSMISYFEATIRNRLARPGGVNTGQALPYKSESWRSGTSVHHMIAGLDTFKQLLQIKWGLGELLQANHQAAIASKLISEENSTRESLQKIQPDLFAAVSASEQSVQAAHADYVQLTSTLKQAANALNIQIGFNDQDGD